ncbi:ATP-binding cassette domain-containing protein [Macrococcus equi]|uniref:ATP-binding cassette domain-containing protein n=1 Tax=Macrococcus equi TaxID=3395462 RepID=UPI0039BEC598
MQDIKVTGANQNNLKNVSLTIPKHKITVFTGKSGSGKSSLVFDTIAAESTRLLNETYSTYIQNQLNTPRKPDVEKIENLPVSMVIGQDRIGGNARSTVGTISDIYSTVRLLWSRVGEPFVGYSMDYSFNNNNGMCPRCMGLGYVEDIDLNELIDFDKSLREGAINFPSFGPDTWRGRRYLNTGLFDNDKPLKDYTKEEMELFLYQEPMKIENPPHNWPKSAKYEGLIYRFRRNFLTQDSFEKKRFKKDIDRVVTEQVCPECGGARLNHRVLQSKINGMNIAQFCDLTISEALDFLDNIHDEKAQYIIETLKKRMAAMNKIGLGYLSLNRVTTTLSGGESQRIKLIKHLISPLTDILYILDEPSVGLHPQDIENITEIIYELKKKGNTVIIVEHDPDVIKIADHCVDIGPDSGKQGGQITFEGTYDALLQSDTATGKALSARHSLKQQPRKAEQFIKINNITKNNLKNVSVKLPRHALTVVTGVAGTGKSTLIKSGLSGDDVILIDQKPVQATSRSNLMTYLDIFDDLRDYYSKHTGLSKSMFSFNSKGACPECNGKGVKSTELAFMSDYVEVCEACNGKRYCEEVLEAKVDGYSIADVLDLTVEEAIAFFGDSAIKEVLEAVAQAGLTYLTIGQSLDTLSGGEVQRVKLSYHLRNKVSDKIFIFDEPTTGLHESDIHALETIFDDLIARNNTVIAIEHNLTIMTIADWIVDVGPLAGLAGGKVLYNGEPKGLFEVEDSYTAEHLKAYINKG